MCISIQGYVIVEALHIFLRPVFTIEKSSSLPIPDAMLLNQKGYDS